MASCSQYLTKEKEDELRYIANTIIAPGKGILAVDERIGSMDRALGLLGLKNTMENRRLYHEILYTAPDECAKHISGVIMSHETFYQRTADGTPFVELLQRKGIIPGITINVDITKSCSFDKAVEERFDSLAVRCAQYKKDGAQFAKWRCIYLISGSEPNRVAMGKIGDVTFFSSIVRCWLARYAIICQQHGLVPIVEPEILPDGEHDLALSQKVTAMILSYCYRALNEHDVFLEGTLLKLNVCTAGMQYTGPKPSHEEIGRATVTAIQRAVPPAIPGVIFLSGGQSETDAALNLNAISQFPGKKPWALTFSYGRGPQTSVLSTWGGKPENMKKAGEALLERTKANSLASQGKFTDDEGAAVGESLHVANRAY